LRSSSHTSLVTPAASIATGRRDLVESVEAITSGEGPHCAAPAALTRCPSTRSFPNCPVGSSDQNTPAPSANRTARGGPLKTVLVPTIARPPAPHSSAPAALSRWPEMPHWLCRLLRSFQ